MCLCAFILLATFFFSSDQWGLLYRCYQLPIFQSAGKGGLVSPVNWVSEVLMWGCSCYHWILKFSPVFGKSVSGNFEQYVFLSSRPELRNFFEELRAVLFGWNKAQIDSPNKTSWDLMATLRLSILRTSTHVLQNTVMISRVRVDWIIPHVASE